jgi:hypothetical protein
MHHPDMTMDASFWLWRGGYTAFHPLRRGLYNFSSLNKMVRSLCPLRRGLHTFSSIETRVIQLFIHHQEGDKFFLIWEEGCTPFHPPNSHPLRRGLHKCSSIEERVTNLFHPSSFHPLRRVLHNFSSINKTVTLSFLDFWTVGYVC